MINTLLHWVVDVAFLGGIAFFLFVLFGIFGAWK